MIVYGSGNADANRHTCEPAYPLAGGGGGALTPGRYVKVGGKPTTNLIPQHGGSLRNQGVERFGDSTGQWKLISLPGTEDRS
jgi:hypothetical protein